MQPDIGGGLCQTTSSENFDVRYKLVPSDESTWYLGAWAKMS